MARDSGAPLLGSDRQAALLEGSSSLVDAIDRVCPGEPTDQFAHTVLECDPRLVAEELPRPGDVREAVPNVP